MLLLNFKAYFLKSLDCTVVIIHHDGSKTERNFVFNSVANMGRSVELRKIKTESHQGRECKIYVLQSTILRFWRESGVPWIEVP